MERKIIVAAAGHHERNNQIKATGNEAQLYGLGQDSEISLDTHPWRGYFVRN